MIWSGPEPLSAVKKIVRIFEDIDKHVFCQSPRIGVVAGAVIAGKNPVAADVGACAVPEGMFGQPAAKHPNGRIMRDLAKREHGSQFAHCLEGCRQKSAARIDFRTDRLVCRRHAPHGIGDGR